jgi:hypothetical protein
MVVCALLGAGVARADVVFADLPEFGQPINTDRFELGASFSSDELELYFASGRSGGSGSLDVWVSRRATTEDRWGTPVNLGSTVNTSSIEGCPCISFDGLELYFGSSRPGTLGDTDLWVSRRTTTEDAWGTPVNLGSTVNTSVIDESPSLSSDGLELYFNSDRTGWKIWVTKRHTRDDPWGPAEPLTETINSSGTECHPSISANGLMLLFAAQRPGGPGSYDIWISKRADKESPWEEPEILPQPPNNSIMHAEPTLNHDGTIICYGRNMFGNWDLVQMSVLPVVDFNGDGKADGKDVVILTEHWGQSDSVCDIGPYAWGDGIVDEYDLFVLAEYLDPDEDVVDPTLIAHWALDETEGMLAFDSAGDNDATVMGAALWQPTGGAVEGALEFNGMTFAVADSILNPSDGPFSVLAWVKAGEPGQVVVAQQAGADWLMADAIDGSLMTDLRAGGRSPVSLGSQTVIADGNWHHVAFVWDGINRRLYVDDVLVAEDTQVSLEGSAGKQLIGCGANMAPSTFFTGLIDDVRIYNRPIKP